MNGLSVLAYEMIFMSAYNVPGPGPGIILVNIEKSKGWALSARIQSLMEDSLNIMSTVIEV